MKQNAGQGRGKPPGPAKKTLVNLLVTGGILLIAVVLCEGLYRLGAGQQDIIIVVVLAVFITSAVTDGYAYGLASTLAGVFLYDFLVTQPRFGFSFTIGFPITLLIMLLVTLTTSTVTGRIKKQTQIAREKERRAELLYDINNRLLSSRDEGSIAGHAMDYLVNDLHRSVALFTRFDNEENPAFYFRRAEGDADGDFFSAPAEWAAALRAKKRGEATGAGTANCRDAAGHYLPIASQGAVYGVVGVCCQKGPLTQDNLAFLRLICGQTAQALQVQALSARQQEIMVMAETEKARSSFLRGISHDLRTPLTSIIGASATLLESEDELSPATRGQLVAGIHADSQWLLSMVENILSITRLHQSDMAIAKTEEAAEEVAGQAVAAFRRRWPGAAITILQPDELLLVPMDALLITQVINNLLDNTQRHGAPGGTAVTIEIARQNGYAEFHVTDSGPGVGRDVLDSLFEIQPARPGHGEDASRGLGIGLSICKTIIQAHEGWIEACNLPQGGARFTFALPIPKEEGHGE